jgi:hypothetical protein
MAANRAIGIKPAEFGLNLFTAYCCLTESTAVFTTIGESAAGHYLLGAWYQTFDGG